MKRKNMFGKKLPALKSIGPALDSGRTLISDLRKFSTGSGKQTRFVGCPTGPAPALPVKNGTVKNSADIDFTGDFFHRTHASDPGVYVFFGMWKGPFADAQTAKAAYREWAWEAQHS